jgi:hypothetical protein
MAIAVEYLGFRTTPSSREYLLRCRMGADRRDYTVAIAHRAFASGQAKYQDGPAICYEKLERELQGPEPSQASAFEISDEDLVLFQKAHASPQKRRHKAASPDAPDGEAPDGAPAPTDDDPH